MGKRDRERKPARREPFADPKIKILVVTEGLVTEPEYIDGFMTVFRNPRVDVKTVGGQGAPVTVVTVARDAMKANAIRAVREKDENIRYDEVWCAFDVDDHPNINNAKEMARDNGIKLAVSHPCVELWLYLHFADQPGAQPRDDMLRLLKKHVPGYDKHVDFKEYVEGYDEAERRAERLDNAADLGGDLGRNPTTGFWKLTKSIRESA